MKILLTFASLLVFLLPSLAQEPHILQDIPYIANGHERQVLDVYLPENIDSPVPTLLMIHGGGFIFGDKDEMRSVAQFFQEAGYATVAPNYRLAPDYTYPAQIEDVFCALAWTVNHAEEYGFDLTRLVLVGESAGANAAALLGTVDIPEQYLTDCPYSLPDSFQARAVVAYYMPVDLTSCDCVAAQQMAALYLGIPQEETSHTETMQDRWADASPLYWIDENDPPFLLVHGERDSLVPLSESLAFQQAYEAVGGEVTLITVPLLNHGFFRLTWLPPVQNALEDVQQFIADVLAEE
ncbi:MAG: alpha/beta hydrolase [Anaerolineae bacterium]|nr:alpha/beta hydrolase [Anaerolineae bacterium]